jgi:HAD superfamily hydrolase (TIGR01509 family)
VTSILFDFNGTISDDEPLLCAIFQELFATENRPLTEREYFDRLAGLADDEIVSTWLGRDDDRVVARKVALYRERASDGRTVDDETRAAVMLAAEQGPTAVVSGASRAEIEPVLAAAGLEHAFTALVAMEDVEHGKPDPAGYRRALELLGIEPQDAVAIEDSPPGVVAAKAAGIRCVGLTRTFPTGPLQADLYAERVDRALIRRLGSSAC